MNALIQKSEQDLQEKIVVYLEAKGFFVVKTIVSNKAGVLDVIACDSQGGFWAVEVKRQGKKPTELQNFKMQKILKLGGVAFYADNFEFFVKSFGKLAKSKGLI